MTDDMGVRRTDGSCNADWRHRVRRILLGGACQIAFAQVLHKAQLTAAAVINKTRTYRTSRETQVVDGITG